MDPIKHKLFFERFLNPGRHDPPDIDIDFPWDERDGLVDWVFARYGARSAAMVANQNMLGVTGSLREVAKVYGIPADEIKRTTDQIRRQSALFGEERQTADQWVQRVTKGLHLHMPWPKIIREAIQLDEQFRNLGLHCGGLVIVPDEIRRYVPVEVSAKGLPVIQWEKDQTEDAGLVKIDLLGNRSLAVIRDALTAIERNTGRHIDYATWDPLADPATQTLIQQGDTMGCFYIESPATRLLLKKLWRPMPPALRDKADVFEYLTIVSSLVRPAANTFIDEFLRRAHGLSYTPLHAVLDEILAETFGIMIYQEDVTKVVMALAGFLIEDGDQLRKVLSKKHKRKKLRDYYVQFVQGASARGVSRNVIDHIWDMIMSFAGYSFCKPHSASYAQVSFKSAYLRIHYSAEFMAAVISNEGGFYSTFAYLSEARRMGLTILPPDLNRSAWAYTGKDHSIQMGLMHIKGLHRDLVEQCVTEREKNGLYRSFFDWLERVRPDPDQARILIKAGCCTSFAGELTRPALIWRLLASQEARKEKAASLFERQPSRLDPLPIPEEYEENRQIQDEIRYFGFPLRCHPLDLCRTTDRDPRLVEAWELDQYVGQSVTLEGWLLTEKPAETKHGESMEFLTFEDRTAIYDVTMFPQTYRRFCHLLHSHTGHKSRAAHSVRTGCEYTFPVVVS